MITTQIPIEHWHAVIGKATVADAILDRLVHNAYRIELTGGSLRRLDAPGAAGTTTSPATEHPSMQTPPYT